MLELLNYVVWGNGSVSARLWNAIRSDDWAIPHIGLSSLGEIVGWARPDEFPPRNMRTSKGHINRPASRGMLTLDFRHVWRNILQSLARISSSEAA